MDLRRFGRISGNGFAGFERRVDGRGNGRQDMAALKMRLRARRSTDGSGPSIPSARAKTSKGYVRGRPLVLPHDQPAAFARLGKSCGLSFGWQAISFGA